MRNNMATKEVYTEISANGDVWNKILLRKT